MNKTVEYYNKVAETYTDTYYNKVSPNSIRLGIILKRFKELDVKSAVDVGSGSCYPLIQMLEAGIDACGFDMSPKMVEVGKQALIGAGLDPSRNFLANLEYKIPFHCELHAIMMHGPLMHAVNERKLLKNAYKMLEDGGTIMCEVRNELMSAFSMNEYSRHFYLDLVEADKLPKKIKKDVYEYYSKLQSGNDSMPWDSKVGLTKLYNPFTVGKLFNDCGFDVIKFHFANFHCLPPIFKDKYPKEYRELSLKMENPDDWRGYLMASTFLLEGRKK